MVIALVTALTVTLAQPSGRSPGMRRHTATKSQSLRLVPATAEPTSSSQHGERTEDGKRVFESNGIREHKVGQFPNRGNPHAIAQQRCLFKIPHDPEVADQIASAAYPAGRWGPPNRPFENDRSVSKYEGAFTRDYENVEASGTLDECNGRFCVTPDFSGGTYAYFLTKDWPLVPRKVRGTPIDLRSSGPSWTARL